MSSTPIFRTIVKAGALLALAVAVVGGVIGLLVAGTPGLIGAVLGAVVAAIMITVTAASIILANRFQGSELFVPVFFGVVLGGWILKFVVFFVLLLTLADAAFLDRTVFLLCIVAGIVGSLAVDVLVVSRSRMGYVSDAVLPGENSTGKDGKTIR